MELPLFMKNRRKQYLTIYSVFSMMCFLFAVIFEYYNRSVFSGFLMFAFMIPLAFGIVPLYLLRLNRKRLRDDCDMTYYHMGVLTLTIGSMVTGISEIAHLTNPLLYLYLAGGILMFILWIAENMMVRKKTIG